MSLKVPVAVIIMTKNESRVIERTVNSVRDFLQVFVVDSMSSDGTPEIAAAAGATVIPFKWNGRYPKKKEWCMKNLPFETEWVLYLDADELVSQELVQEIRTNTREDSKYAAFDADLDYLFLGRRLRHGHLVSKRVLLRRSLTIWPQPDDLGSQNMWEVEGHYQPKIDGSVGKLTTRLIHEDLDPLFDYFLRHNKYSDWEAYVSVSPRVQHEIRGSRSNKAQKYESVPFKPVLFFLYSYFLRCGWLDGRAGFHYSVAHAFYYWQIGLKRSELLRTKNV